MEDFPADREGQPKRKKQKIRIRYRERVRIKERPRGFRLKRFLRKNRQMLTIGVLAVITLALVAVVAWHQISEEQRDHLRFMQEKASGWHIDWN